MKDVYGLHLMMRVANVRDRAALGDGMGEVLRINAQFTAYLPVIVPPGTAETTP